MVGGAIPGMVGLGSISKQAEQVLEIKTVHQHPSWALASRLQNPALFEFVSQLP